MAFCKNCGAEMQENEKFCGQCGTQVEEEATAEQATTEEKKEGSSFEDTVSKAVDSAQEAFDKFTDTPDTTSEYSESEIQNGKVMGVLSYIGILVLIPIFAEKENKFVRFHANQGLTLFGVEIIFNIVTRIIISILAKSWTLWRLISVLSAIFSLCNLVLAAAAILGIVYVCTGKAKELPVIGKFKFLK